jgi:hypothetical protein
MGRMSQCTAAVASGAAGATAHQGPVTPKSQEKSEDSGVPAAGGYLHARGSYHTKILWCLLQKCCLLLLIVLVSNQRRYKKEVAAERANEITVKLGENRQQPNGLQISHLVDALETAQSKK